MCLYLCSHVCQMNIGMCDQNKTVLCLCFYNRYNRLDLFSTCDVISWWWHWLPLITSSVLYSNCVEMSPGSKLSPCWVGSVGSVSASRTLGREFASWPGHTKDHHKNGTNCLPA